MKVEILLPNTTFGKTKYKFLQDVALCGYTIPVGFITDGASVPRLFWWLFPPVGRYFLAAALHDYLLLQGKSRYVSNLYFLSALKMQKVTFLVCYIMFCAVSIYMAFKTAREWIMEQIYKYTVFR